MEEYTSQCLWHGILKTNIDQDAATLGASAVAAYGTGIWKDYDIIDRIIHALNKHLQ